MAIQRPGLLVTLPNSADDVYACGEADLYASGEADELSDPGESTPELSSTPRWMRGSHASPEQQNPVTCLKIKALPLIRKRFSEGTLEA